MAKILYFDEIEYGCTDTGLVYVEKIAKRDDKIVLTMVDGKGRHAGAAFTEDANLFETVYERTVIAVSIEKKTFKTPEFIVKEVQNTDMLPKDFLEQLSEMKANEMFEDVASILFQYRLIDSHANFNSPSWLAYKILSDNVEDVILYSESIQDEQGSFIKHIYTTVVIAYAIARKFSDIDAGMLLAGAALHDIGKLRYYDYDGTDLANISQEGILFTCSEISADMIECYANDFNYSMTGNYSSETVRNLRHMILSLYRPDGTSGGPATMEAKLLKRIISLADTLLDQRKIMNLMRDGTGFFMNQKSYYKPVSTDKWYYDDKSDSDSDG